MSVCRTACPYDCPDGCSLLATVEEGRVVRVTGDPANPYTGGLVCAKPAHFPQSVNSPHRLTVPLRRTGPKGSGQFAPISREEAIREIAGRWKALIAAHGPECILPYSYTGTVGAVQRNCGEGFFHALGACRLERTLCSSAKSAADAARGIRHGDAVMAENELGCVVFTAALDRTVASDTAVAEGVFPGENTVNALSHQHLSDLARATAMNDNTIEVRR